MKPEQSSFFDELPQEMPARPHQMAQDVPDAPEPMSTSPTPLDPPESSRSRQAHDWLEAYVAYDRR